MRCRRGVSTGCLLAQRHILAPVETTNFQKNNESSAVAKDIPEAQDVVEALDQTVQTNKQQEEARNPIAEHDATEVIPIDFRDAPAEPEVDAVPATPALPEAEADVSSYNSVANTTE